MPNDAAGLESVISIAGADGGLIYPNANHCTACTCRTLQRTGERVAKKRTRGLPILANRTGDCTSYPRHVGKELVKRLERFFYFGDAQCGMEFSCLCDSAVCRKLRAVVVL